MASALTESRILPPSEEPCIDNFYVFLGNRDHPPPRRILNCLRISPSGTSMKDSFRFPWQLASHFPGAEPHSNELWQNCHEMEAVVSQPICFMSCCASGCFANNLHNVAN